MGNKILFVDLNLYRNGEERVFRGKDRGAAVRQACNMDTADASEQNVLIQVPDDVFVLSTFFLQGLLGPSIRILGEEIFRQRFGFTQDVWMDQLDDVIRVSLR